MLTRLFALLLAATLGAAADEESCWTKHQRLQKSAERVAPLQCYEYRLGTTGRGVAQHACSPAMLKAVVCKDPKAGCFREEKYKMQRKYELRGGCGGGPAKAPAGATVAACAGSLCNAGELDEHEGK